MFLVGPNATLMRVFTLRTTNTSFLRYLSFFFFLTSCYKILFFSYVGREVYSKITTLYPSEAIDSRIDW